MAQKFTLHKGLIKYNKVNGINPMTTHVQIAHLKLFTLKKQKFSMVARLVATQSWQLRKKRTGPFNYAIIHFFGTTNPYKKMMNISNKFWKIWFFKLTKVTNLCPIVRTFGFEG